MEVNSTENQSNTTKDETWKFEYFPWKAIVIEHTLV